MAKRTGQPIEIHGHWALRGLLVCLWGAVAGCGPAEEPAASRPTGEAALPADAETVLGFEAPDAWLESDGGALEASELRVQGEGALAVRIVDQVVLTSVPFSFERTPNIVGVSVRLPDSAARGVSGHAQAFIECAAQDVFREPLGTRDLSGLPADEFARIEFSVSASLQSRLAGGCERLVLGLVLDAGDAPGTYVVDGMGLRAATPPIAVTSTPLCGLPSIDHLVRDAVETPEGHWDYQSWLVEPALSDELRWLEPALAPYTDVVLGTATDHVNREIVVVVDESEFVRGNVQQALESAELALPLRIQPSCHPVPMLRSALELTETYRWSADSPTHVGHLDTALGAVVVTVDVEGTPSPEEIAWNERRRFGLERIRPAGLFVPSPKSLAMARTLEQELGTLVQVRYGRPGKRSQESDGQPHYGGAGIGFVPGVNVCAAGFVVTKSVGGVLQAGAVGAGHCFPISGTSIFSGTKAYGRSVGTPVFSFDAIYIEPNGQIFASIIHTGPSSPVTRPQVWKVNAAIPQAIHCVSSRIFGAKCGIEATDRLCFVRSPPFTQDTTRLTRGVRAGVNIGESGDSGAPVYSRSGTGAIINGMEVGGAVSDEICWHDVSAIESRLGVKVAF